MYKSNSDFDLTSGQKEAGNIRAEDSDRVILRHLILDELTKIRKLRNNWNVSSAAARKTGTLRIDVNVRNAR